MSYYDIQKDILKHHGVRGMRWGVRKAVTSTSSTSSTEAPKKPSLSKESVSREKSWRTQYKKRGQMSNEQLKKEVDRLRLESEFKRLSTEVNKNNQTRGQKLISQFKDNTINEISSQLPQALVKAAISQAIGGGSGAKNGGGSGANSGAKKKK